jgi:putative N6-adenine-specific DNA methylase
MFEVYAVITPGLEAVALQELEILGIADAQPEEGGLSFEASFEKLCRLNLQSRISSRFIVRVGTEKITTLKSLQIFANPLPWKNYIRPNQPLQVRATCKKSKLYHSGAVVERFQNALDNSLGKGLTYVKGEDIPSDTQRIVIRVHNDIVTVSIDSSGEHLHKRGYRQATAKAPLRENIAAGCLASMGYDGSMPFLDSMTGSGTLAIEAALIAKNRVPGLNREFGFMQWPMFRPKRWQDILGEYRAQETNDSPPIFASDRHPGAIEAALQNADLAGVRGLIEFERATLTQQAQAMTEFNGTCFLNPPYGERMGNQGNLNNLYASINNMATGPLSGWNTGLITTNQQLMRSSCPAFKVLGPPVFHGGKRAYIYNNIAAEE